MQAITLQKVPSNASDTKEIRQENSSDSPSQCIYQIPVAIPYQIVPCQIGIQQPIYNQPMPFVASPAIFTAYMNYLTSVNQLQSKIISQASSNKAEKKEPEENLEDLPEFNTSKKLFKGKSYKYRNIYKGILKYMERYIKKNTEDIKSILKGKGYSPEEIEQAFSKIIYYSEKEQARNCLKVSQGLIKKMLSKKNIYCYILRETSYALIQGSKKKALWKVNENNMCLYEEVSTAFYNEAVKLTSGQAEGKTFILS
jgi:hypothetical protein